LAVLIRIPSIFGNNTKEVAQNFKEQGNEYFRGKKYREALGFYTQGVDAKPDNTRVKEALLLNRAACNLELRTSLPLLRSSSELMGVGRE
jgi:small subunit ribosomal protein S7e